MSARLHLDAGVFDPGYKGFDRPLCGMGTGETWITERIDHVTCKRCLTRIGYAQARPASPEA